MASRVTSGLFLGFTLPQLETARQSLAQKLMDFGPDRAVSLNVNSSSFAFAERGGMSIDRMQTELLKAFHEVDPEGWPDTILERTVFSLRGSAPQCSANTC